MYDFSAKYVCIWEDKGGNNEREGRDQYECDKGICESAWER